MARDQAEKGQGYRTGIFNDNMREHFRLAGAEVRDTLLQILDEVPPESYQPPSELKDPPGCPFIYRSSVLGREIYFKVQIKGTARKPQVLFWSCHPPRYSIERELL
jgi:hypothetical protein